MINYWRQRRAANRAAQRAQTSRQQLLAEASGQQQRWQQRAPWLLPLMLLAGYLLGRARPGQQLWQLGRGLLRVGRWLQRGARLSLAHHRKQPASPLSAEQHTTAPTGER